MAKTLVIVESPTKAKAIGKFLGSKYVVKSSMGHIRDLPKSQLGVDVDNEFTPKYINIRGKGELLKSLRAEAKKSAAVLLASDPDREGEVIAWHLKDYLQIPNEDCRVEFNEITKDAVKKAIAAPHQIDIDRVNAQQARRILDRLVGYKLSPLLWKKVKKGLSAGRVQSVAVRLICDREDEIAAFVPEEYWRLEAMLSDGESKFKAKLAAVDGHKAQIGSEKQMNEVLTSLQNAVYQVSKITKKEKHRRPAPPFITSSLQQEAARKLSMTAKKTMQLAQQLYEGIDLGKDGVVGLITYMRTDSVRLSETAQAAAADYIREKYGEKYLPPKPPQYTAKGKIQNAHEAIRPSDVTRTPELIKKYLTQPQYRLYSLIWKRFVASQMEQALIDVTTIDIAASNCIFRASGSIIRFKGFMEAYVEGHDEEKEEDDFITLPQLSEGQKLVLDALEPHQLFTQPPSRFNEATLVKSLEEQGIGRPSTYAPIIDTILARGYVVKEEKQFYPTELGRIIVNLLKDNFADIINVNFTADMEKSLDKVEEGSIEWHALLSDFYGPFARLLAAAEENMAKVEIKPEESGEMCPQCGRPLLIKMGKYGKFLACSGFPECRYTKAIVISTGIKCLACGGNIIQCKSRGGRIFFGCDNYPKCRYVAWNTPIDKLCPQCGTQLSVKENKNGQKQEICPNTDCPSNKGRYKAKAKPKE